MKINHRSADRIRLVCFDVDYTLLNDDQQLLPMTEQTLKNLQLLGVKVILATGKNLNATRDIVDRLELNDPLIFSNGSIIQYRDGRIFSRKEIDPERARQVIQLGDEHELDMMISIADDVFVKEDGRFVHNLDKYGNSKLIEVKQWQDIGSNLEHIQKIVFIDEDHSELVKMNGILNSSILSGIKTTYSLSILLEVQPEGVSKGSALRELTQFLDYPREAVIVFGDGDNDIEMVEFAGIGVAVENATPGLKKVADLIVPSNNEEGPAQLLNKIVNLR